LREYLEYLQQNNLVPATTGELLRMITESAEEYGYDPGEIKKIWGKIAAEKAPDTPDEPGKGRRILWWLLLLALIVVSISYYRSRSRN
ncbi:MAG: hypothetical protein EA408_11625, partial [Marinilabiliales bacterium]